MIGKEISHYKIIKQLGVGGMGEVYLADDLKLERQVALKFLPQHLTIDRENVERFEREAKAAAALNHPNIITIYDVIEADGQICIVMEYVDGESLRNKMDKGKLDQNEVIDITSQICEGLSKAHQADIVHRDIKPENILINTDGRVKILDFGLAKLKGVSKLTKETSILGTIHYMSPEQIQGKDVDHRSDIWSFGVVLYEMLTGEVPFKGEYESAVIYSILNESQEPLTTLCSNVPKELEQIINKCLSKNPTERYQNVADVVAELKLIKDQSDLNVTQIKHKVSTTNYKSRLFIPSLVIVILIGISILYLTFFKTTGENSSSPERKKLVVLPFKNLGSPEDEYFADGITEEITSRLSEIKKLGVISRTSADLYKNTKKSISQISVELGVEYLIEGSVRWEKVSGKQSRIRVTPQLIRISDGTHIWTERYDAILESVFDIQTDIAEKVTAALDITLLGSEQKSISKKLTDNLEAYDYYLRGNNFYIQRGFKDNFRKAEKMFKKAVDLDSNFVLPYIRLAQVNISLYWFYIDRNKSILDNAKYYIDKAMELNPNIPEIYLVLGHYYYHGFLEYDKALFEIERGLVLSPDNSEMLGYIGYVKRRQGKFEESIKYFKKSAELNPLSELNIDIGYNYLLLKKYDLAEKYIDVAISSMPKWGYAYYTKAQIYIFLNGDVNRAHQILNDCINIVNKDKDLVSYLLFQLKILTGKYDEAMKLVLVDPNVDFDGQYYFESKYQKKAKIYDLKNNKSLEKIYYDSARIVIESKLKTFPDDARLHSALGIVLAGLGKKDDAIREGIRATELLPINKEAIMGFIRELDLAKIYTMVGEYNLAINKLEYLLSIPGELSVPYIKLDPDWRPLFKIPRFKKVLEQYK